jgi:hypothetical protein
MKPNGGVTILRWGLAFVFFYAAIASIASPDMWSAYVPTFITAVVSAHLFLTIFSLYELVLAGFLFWGGKLYWSSLAATITLGLIVALNLGAQGFIFLDVGLALSGLALFATTRNDKYHANDALE